MPILDIIRVVSACGLICLICFYPVAIYMGKWTGSKLLPVSSMLSHSVVVIGILEHIGKPLSVYTPVGMVIVVIGAIALWTTFKTRNN